MQKLLRASLLVTALSVLLFVSGTTLTHAQATPSPYRERPTCPQSGVGETVTCTYSNGDSTSCKRQVSGAGGVDLICENTDNTVTSCAVFVGMGGISDICQVRNADGTNGGTGGSVTGGGTTVDRETDGDGNVTSETSSTAWEWQCTQGNLPRCFANLPGMLFTAIAFLFLTLSGFILGLAGTVFNWVVIRTVFQFGTYFGTNEGMLVAWGVMRDVANIGLLFGFILMGVLLILNVEGGGGHGHGGGMSAKKAIPRLIIFAVLLNFSLFASQVVIDVANAFSSSFATLAGESCSTNTSVGTDADNSAQGNEECANVGIAGQVLKVTGLTALWDTEALDIETGMKNVADRPYSYAVSLIMLSIFVLITAIVLLAGAIMLIIRVVILSLLMVTSPVGFAGMAIPKLQGIATMWWSKLMSQAFFAPVYLLLIFISIKLTEGLTEGNATLANALIANEGNSVAGNMQVVMVFLVVIGFMIGSLLAATKMGAMGASFATNAASALAFGAVTRGANFTTGGAAYGLRRIQQKTGFGGRVGEVMVNRGLRPLEKANLDLRRIPGMAGGLGAAGISAGAKAAEHATYADIAHQFSDIKAGKEGQKLHEEYDQEKKNMMLEDNAHHGGMTSDDKAHLASLSTKELEQLHGVKEGVQQLAENLSPEQFENLMKSDKLTDIEKGTLKSGRFSSLNEAAASGRGADVKNLMKTMSKKDLENAPNGVLLQPLVLENLSDQQREDLVKSDKRTPAEKAAIKASYANEVLKTVFTGAGGGAAGAAAVIAHPKYGSVSTAQFAELGVDILQQSSIAQNIPVSALEKIVKDNKLSPAEMKLVGAQMEAAVAAGTASAGVRGYMASPKGDFWR